MTARRWADGEGELDAVYAEGQGQFRVESDPFDDEIRLRTSTVTGDCDECGVEYHELDLFTCAKCHGSFCERHIGEDEHDCVEEDEAREAEDEDEDEG